MSVIGTNMKNVRTKKNLSIKEVAKKAGVSELLLSDIESGKKIPNTQLINSISKILGVSIDAIEPSYFSSYFEEEQSPQIKKEEEPKHTFKKREESPLTNTTISDALSKAIKKIPVLNKITLGKPIPNDNDITDYKLEPTFMNKANNVKGDEFIYFIQNDDSMIGARILKGDLCLIFLTESLLDKDIVLVVYGGKTMIRRYKNIDLNKIILYPENPVFEAIIADKKDIHIVGKVVRVEFKI